MGSEQNQNLNQEIESALDWRYAAKKYDASRKISAADWKTIELSLKKAPSSYGLQPFKFLVIEDQALREKLRAQAWNQTQVTDAAKLVVVLAKERVDEKHIQDYIDNIAKVRGISGESLNGFKDMMLSRAVGLSDEDAITWNQRQAYIALGFALETAALLKIDATPMEGFDPAAFDKILELEGSGWKSVVVAAFGYRHAEDATQNFKKVRREDAHIVQYR